MGHLGLEKGEEFVFVDPESGIYDELALNKGFKETFTTLSTPLAFLDRFTKKDGMKDLMEVLGKWNKGSCSRQHRLIKMHFFSDSGVLLL